MLQYGWSRRLPHVLRHLYPTKKAEYAKLLSARQHNSWRTADPGHRQTARREIGIRVAIGAQAGDIARRVTFDIIAWVSAGSFAGLALAVGFARYIESLLCQVKAPA